VDLSRRPTLRRIVALLFDCHAHAPGAAVPTSYLLTEVWPDVRTRETLPNRLYNAIATLRDLGMEDVVISGDEGYAINPRYAVIRV
jgi:hypothetical protein